MDFAGFTFAPEAVALLAAGLVVGGAMAGVLVAALAAVLGAIDL